MPARQRRRSTRRTRVPPRWRERTPASGRPGRTRPPGRRAPVGARTRVGTILALPAPNGPRCAGTRLPDIERRLVRMTDGPRVAVIGLDCGTPQLLFDRLSDQLPNINALMERGMHGPLA